MEVSRACDRCYKIRARCVPDLITKACARCERLGHICETKRALLKSGRPQARSWPQQLSSPQQSPCSISPPPRESQLILWPQPSLRLQGFTAHEVSLVEFAIHPEQISSLMYGRSFQDALRSTLLTRLYFATDQVKDGFLAIATALLSQKQVTMCGPEDTAHVLRGSRAIRVLASLRESSFEDAKTGLVLALMLVTYNDLMVGAPALPITRSALLQAMPWQNELVGLTTQETDSNLICILFNEMFECLVLGRIPVFCYEPPAGNSIVDRYYGICHELLPCLYQVCLLYKSIRTSTTLLEEISVRTERVLALVDQWSPETVMRQRHEVLLDHDEEQHYMLQARLFKLATEILLLQALRSASTNMLSTLKAGQIEAGISLAMQRGTGRPMYLLFPYFVSCLQMHGTDRELSDDVLTRMNDISGGMAPRSCQSMFACLKHIRHNRKIRPDLPWFQCVDSDLHLAMGP